MLVWGVPMVSTETAAYVEWINLFVPTVHTGMGSDRGWCIRSYILSSQLHLSMHKLKVMIHDQSHI